MTTLSETQIQCPICSRFFKTEVVMSTNQMGQQTDFKPVVGGVFPYPFYIHTCPSCGFSGYQEDFEKRYQAPFREKVRAELSGRVAGKNVNGSDKYLLAAWCAENLKRKKMEIADLYLRAAWCAEDEGDANKERQAREKAAALFEKALASGDVSSEQRAAITYLVGELKRRIGKTGEAGTWFDKVKSEVQDATKQAWILAAAKQQKKNPKQSMPEVKTQ
jgi:hypothetical protein